MSVSKYYNLFKGRENSLGRVTIPGTVDPAKNKKVGHYSTDKEELSEAIVKDHLDGLSSIGQCPIKQNNRIKWAAIDVDDYSIDIDSASTKYSELPFHFCRTKSGGVHIYVFFKREISASQGQDFLSELAYLLGFNGSEIFPKQTKLKEDDQGNWINLPYFGDTRKCVYNGIELTLEQFLVRAEQTAIDKPEDVLSKFIFWGAPPCLQKMYAGGVIQGYRNEFLMNTAVFLKQKFPDNWQEKLLSVNKHLPYPLEEKEINDTVIKQAKKKDYFYQCKSVLKDYCEKEICKKRTFGIGRANSAERLIDSCTIRMTDPPTYILDVAGKKVMLSGEELLTANTARRLIMDKARVVLPAVKSQTWFIFISDLIKDASEEDAPEDATQDNDIVQGFKKFILQRNSELTNIKDIAMDRVYIDRAEGINVFKSEAFVKYAKRESIKLPPNNRLWSILNEKCSVERYKKLSGHRAWTCPLYPEQISDKLDPKTPEDFIDAEKEEDIF